MTNNNDNLFYYKDYFQNCNYKDEFGCNELHSIEINKWLSLIYEINEEFYKQNKNKVKQNVQSREGFLAEVMAVYYYINFIGIDKNKIVMNPLGSGSHELDFSYAYENGEKWFAEVKCPTWHGEKHKNNSLSKKEKINRCNELKYKNGDGGSFDFMDAFEDQIKKALEQFSSGQNNILIVVPDTMVSPIYAPRELLKYKLNNFMQKVDGNHVIKKIVVLDKIYQEEVGYNFLEVYSNL